MDYMDQSVTCKQCGGETSQIITGICPSCEFSARDAARKAEWAAKSDIDKALSILESFANPQHMTFSKERAAFVLGVFRAIATPVAERAAAPASVPEEPVELVGIARQLDDGAGFWQTCSGCHESEDGHDAGRYAYSDALRCKLGNGCSECGGLGAIWDNNDYAEWATEQNAAPEVAQPAAQGESRQLLDLVLAYGAACTVMDERAPAIMDRIKQSLATPAPTAGEARAEKGGA